MGSGYISNEDIATACRPFYRSAVAEWTRVVVRLADAPPFVEAYGALPNYVRDRDILGIVTPEAERMVGERRQTFRQMWGY